MNAEAVLLREITELSHEFGTPAFVKGGGGNTSVKQDGVLWIKPSGTTLAGLQPERFVAVDRARLARLYAMEVPEAAAEREARVKEAMEAAVCGGSRGRPSVETPLHDLLRFRYVVHTHMTLVNGLTCARRGRAEAARLLPDALWVPYVDPGFTLAQVVRERVAAHEREFGGPPAIILLENHGIFVGGDAPDDVRETYRRVDAAMQAAYRAAGVDIALRFPGPVVEYEQQEIAGLVVRLLGPDAAAVVSAAPFELAEGPLTPDHMVYAKAYPYRDPLTAEDVAAFRALRGYAPRIVATPVGVFGVGRSAAAAKLALDLAQDGGLVRQLAEAFGGVQYMSDSARRFIETWEVESYREQLSLRGGG